ncbi:hypothetical protein LIER_23070 [Lithospermum erythrorhizon]|uniref:Uncharacterized protein n=1 Tax=Lithospermum erythrorhizon TaxID=34254 RepID=A0AAV3QWB1_LITER
MYDAVRKFWPKVVLTEISDTHAKLISDVEATTSRSIEVPLLEWHPINVDESSVYGDENEMVHGDHTRVGGGDYFGLDVTILDDSMEGSDDNVVDVDGNIVDVDNIVDGYNVGDVGDDIVEVEDGCNDNGGEGGDNIVGDEYLVDSYDDDDFDTSAFLRHELFDEDYGFTSNDGYDEEVCYMSEGEAYDNLGPMLNGIGPIPEEPFETFDQLKELSEEEDDGEECSSSRKWKSTSDNYVALGKPHYNALYGLRNCN